VSDRFLRKVSRIMLDWSVEAQSLVDARYRRSAKALRRLRRHDPELATRLEAATERAHAGDATAEQMLGSFRQFAEAEREAQGDAAAILAKLRSEIPSYLEDFIRTVTRGADRLAALEPPTGLVHEHAALVAAHSEYVASLHRLAAAYTSDSMTDVTAALDEALRARTTLESASARLRST
jgi:hypothetical protein